MTEGREGASAEGTFAHLNEKEKMGSGQQLLQQNCERKGAPLSHQQHYSRSCAAISNGRAAAAPSRAGTSGIALQYCSSFISPFCEHALRFVSTRLRLRRGGGGRVAHMEVETFGERGGNWRPIGGGV